jgi:hypothetical protein
MQFLRDVLQRMDFFLKFIIAITILLSHNFIIIHKHKINLLHYGWKSIYLLSS